MSFIKHNPIPIHPMKDAAAILLRVPFFISENCYDLVTSKSIQIQQKSRQQMANAKHIQLCMQLKGHHMSSTQHHAEPLAWDYLFYHHHSAQKQKGLLVLNVPPIHPVRKNNNAFLFLLWDQIFLENWERLEKIIKLVQDALHENRIKWNLEVTLKYSTSITR